MSSTTAESTNASKKGKKKSKGKTMPLQDFLGDKTSGTNYNKDPPKLTGPSNSWADSMEDIDPSEISTTWPEEQKVFDRSVLPSGPKASAALQIDKSRLPTSPPYTVYLGNLSWECTEDDIVRFFEKKKLIAKSVRLPMETGTNRMRGFGYAEFDTVSDLMEALELNKEILKNRPVAVDIAGDKGGDDYGGRGRRSDLGEDRTSGDWRRGGGDETDGPTPSGRDYQERNSYGGPDRRYGGRNDYNRDGGYGGRGRYGSGEYERGDRGYERGGYERRDRGYDRGGYERGDRGYERGGYERGDRGYDRGGYDRGDRGGYDRGYGGRDDYGGRGGYRDRGYERGPPRSRGFGQSWQDGGDREDDYGDRRDNRYGDRYGDRRDDRYGDRRGYGGRGRYGGRGNSPGDQADEPPVERPRIKLAPRTKPVEEADKPEKSGGGASIFGGAKPVDTAAREKEMEERLAKEKELQEKQAKEKAERQASVFGGAKPVDTTAREREIEEKLAKENEKLERKLSESDKSPERSHDRRNRTPEYTDKSRDRRDGSHDKSERSHDQRDEYDSRDSRGSRGGRRRRFSSEEEGRRDRRRGHSGNYQDEDGSSRDHDREGDQRRDNERRDSDQRSSQERAEGDEGRRRGDDKRRRGGSSRGGGERRDDRKGYNERRDHGDRGDRGRRDRGRGRGGGRPRDREERRDEDRSTAKEKGSKPSTSAWSKGKPRSLGGVDQKKVPEDAEPVFSRPSRYATLQDDAEESGSGGEGQRSPSPAAAEASS